MEIQTFKEFIIEKERNKKIEKILLCEHEVYKNISGTKKSYRIDSQNLNTKTQEHVHVYAKRHGKGKELYSVNIDGTGHDGSSRKQISTTEANFFRKKGFEIPSNNILESIDYNQLASQGFQHILVKNEEEGI